MESFLEGRWYKFINNDGQEVALDLPGQVTEFSEKSISFAHWAFNYFKREHSFVISKVITGSLQLCKSVSTCGNFRVRCSYGDSANLAKDPQHLKLLDVA